MKKITAIILSFTICLCFVSCGKESTNIVTTRRDTAEESTTHNLIDTPEIMESTIINKENFPKSDNKMMVTGTADKSTKSGFAPLEKISYTATDPENSRGLSTKKISHSHGPASDGKAHYTVVEFQKNMEKATQRWLFRVIFYYEKNNSSLQYNSQV